MLVRSLLGAVGAVLTFGQVSDAIQLDMNSPDSIKAAAKTALTGALKYYNGNEPGQVPGLLVQPYFWWEAGAMFGEMIAYSHYTGDSSYNDLISQAMLFQVGDKRDFMPANQTKSEGNDDQLFWAFAAMTAAELKFPDPPSDQPSWLSLAQAVFNNQVARWDTNYCGGGLRWQIFFTNKGYNNKNTISNAGFFQLASRLARYTNNQTYADWANKAYGWVSSSLILTPDWKVYDGMVIDDNCTSVDQHQWSYNLGALLMGSANMYNFTDGDPTWKARIDGLLKGSAYFFPTASGGKIMSEVTCEPTSCDTDQRSFKAYLSRWMASTAQLVPYTAATIMPLLKASAVGAAGQCSGGSDGVTCGQKWYNAAWDGNSGVGEQLSALAIFGANLIGSAPGPVSDGNGGTSKSDPTAGSGDSAVVGGNPIQLRDMTALDRIGGALVTIGILVGLMGTGWFMIWMDSHDPHPYSALE